MPDTTPVPPTTDPDPSAVLVSSIARLELQPDDILVLTLGHRPHRPHTGAPPGPPRRHDPTRGGAVTMLEERPPKPVVDPLCLCGRPHPCPEHGKVPPAPTLFDTLDDVDVRGLW